MVLDLLRWLGLSKTCFLRGEFRIYKYVLIVKWQGQSVTMLGDIGTDILL